MVDNEELEMKNEDNSIKGDKIIEAVDEEEIQKDGFKEDSTGIKFVKRILATIVDQIISLSIALILLMVFDFILKLVGLYVAERQPMFLIVYVITNIIYVPVCESTRLKKTIGKNIMLK